MPLPWSRMDNNWLSNPKFLMLAEDRKWKAICVYWGGVCYSSSHGHDGFLPFYCLPTFHGTRREAGELVAVRLWQSSDGGWDINDFMEYQLTSEENAARSQRARDAALVRWNGAGRNASRNARRSAARNARRMPDA